MARECVVMTVLLPAGEEATGAAPLLGLLAC